MQRSSGAKKVVKMYFMLFQFMWHCMKCIWHTPIWGDFMYLCGYMYHQIMTTDLEDMIIELLHSFSLCVETCVTLEEGTHFVTLLHWEHFIKQKLLSNTYHCRHWRYHSMALSFLRDLVHPDLPYSARTVRYFMHTLIHDSLELRKVRNQTP
jgi:hypothetical protein